MDKTECQAIVEGNVMLPADVRQGADGIVVTYTTSRADGESNLGHVITRFEGEKPSQVILTADEGDYGPPSVAQADQGLWVAHTAYAHKQKSILLHAIADKRRTASVRLAGPAKIDNPHIAVHAGALHAVWEDYSSGDALVVYQVLDPHTLTPKGSLQPITQSKAYKPQLISDGSRLYLVYEHYYGKRYRIMTRCLTPGAATFSEQTEVGFETQNDQDATLAIHEGKLLVAWENSSPLEKGYAWTSPAGNTVVMPGFGHGWRVNTRMGLRRVTFDDQGWHLENLVSDSADPVLQLIDEQEAAGVPRLQVDDSDITISYVRWERGSASIHRGWQIRTKRFDGRRWISIGVSELIQKQRVHPAVWMDTKAGQHHVFGQAPERETSAWNDWTQESAATYHATFDLPGLAHACPPEFVTAWRSQTIRPAARPAPRRITVTFEDRKRQLLWGDLHMHSNLSGCSLGERFHCTEVEKKFRF